VGTHLVESILITPVRDTNGNLRGVIQLVNKLNSLKITNQDVIEIDALMPALGEVFKTAE
jgi:hypothetical protein